MSEQKLRKFRLIDKDGYVNHHVDNKRYLKYLVDGCFTGTVCENGAVRDYATSMLIIGEAESKFFEEISLEEEDNIQQTHISNDNEPPSNEISATFSDEMIHCIKEDCHAVNGSLCFYKEGVVFLWNEDEYFIESVDDYNKVINSIKVLNSFKK